MNNNYSIMVHGGAGELAHVTSDTDAESYHQSIIAVLEQGRTRLQGGECALEVAAHCAALLENDPLFNAGRGSVLNEDGMIEMDAAVMDGATLAAGAVAGVRNIRNPVELARKVMEKSEHVMLMAEGAMRFADRFGLTRAPDDYFMTEERLKQWQEARGENRIGLDHDGRIPAEPLGPDDKYGTIGAVVRDVHGNLAAATSTGGIVNKHFGRVGDTPIIGSGIYADNETCAAACTGLGEDFMRTVLAKMASDFIHFNAMDAAAAVEQAIGYLTRKVNGRGGMILVDRDGRCAGGFTTAKMIRGWIQQGGESLCRLWP